MTRVVAGTAGGRRLQVPRGRATRPTSDRAREALFSTLASLRGSLSGARVLDLYAGTGAVGIEALSRGAARASFVESDELAARAIRANLEALGLAGGNVHHERVERFLGSPPGEPAYDVVFADPPYDERASRVSANLAALVDGWLATDAVVVVERASRDPEWQWPSGLTAVRHRRYGDSTLWYGHKS